jgi:hypothetical protein
MKVKLTTLLLALFATGQAVAHASHAHAVMHGIEHLMIMALLLAPALLLVRPATRRFATQRAK